jgi:uncharacterized membrane protein YuzA (DUF378 family)
MPNLADGIFSVLHVITLVGGLNWFALGVRALALDGWPGAIRMPHTGEQSSGDMEMVGLPDLLEWMGPGVQMVVYLTVGVASCALLLGSLSGWWIRRGTAPLISCASV